MGQAQSRPASSDAAAEAASPADDLLSQLAGEDIDRMLAEADVESTAAGNCCARAVDAFAICACGGRAHGFGFSAESTAIEPPVAAAGSAGGDAVCAEDGSEGLDELLSSAAAAEKSDANPAAPPAQVPADDAANAEPAPRVEQNRTTTAAPSTDQRSAASGAGDPAPKEPEPVGSVARAAESNFAPGPATTKTESESPLAPSDASSSDTDEQNPEAEDPREDEPASLLVRILQLINSPLDAFPDRIREAIGKIALVTMINALAVIVYVMFFRHK